MKTSELLRAAWGKIETPATFSQLEAAKNGVGLSVDPLDPTAECFCAMGALFAAADPTRTNWLRASRFLDKAAESLFDIPRARVHAVVYVNDNHGHEAVGRVYALAIEMAEKEEQQS